ncbi:MAG TPA: glycosyltransferase [bacterium]|nr:glycosyltransferase [bacterium]
MVETPGRSDFNRDGSRIRVVRIISGLWPGGVEKKLTGILPRLDRNRFDVSVVCLRAEGELAPALRNAGIPVDLCRVKRRWSPTGLWRLSRYLKSHRVDVVHTHMYRSNVTGTVAARLAGTPVVVSQVHNVDNWDDRRQIWTDRRMAAYRDCTVFVSGGVRDDYLSRIALPDGSYTVIYNGVDTGYYTPGQADGLLDGRIVVGAAARLVPQKGLDVLVRAAAEPALRENGVVFYVAGDGPEREHLMHQAEKAGVSGCFKIIGFQSDIRRFYRNIDIFAMPSMKEGFSNALVEAMACGVPVVATAVGGNPEAVRNRENGFLVSPGNYNEFRDALLKMVLQPNVRKQMSHRAVETAEGFSQQRMIEQTETLYLTLLNKKRK